MKHLLTILFLFCTLFYISNTKILAQNIEGQITISGAFALYPMAVKWAEEFKALNPKVKIDISAGGAGKGITDALNNMVDLGMVSRDLYPEEINKGAFSVSVTKDAVVPVINTSNPVIKEIVTIGIKKETAINIWLSGTYKTWGQAFGIKSNVPLRVYTRSDACGAAEIWAKFLGKKQEDLNGVGVFGDPGIAAAVKKDPLGLGYNNIAYAYDQKTKKPNQGIRVLPIDLNNNGKIDNDENFYDTQNQIVAAIADGRYPSPPARDLFFISNGKPKNQAVIAFLKWILTDGQKYVAETGYISLPNDKLSKEGEKLK